jgi:diaminopimelate epimerase
MKFSFFKYQGTGNDFIIIDDRQASFPIDEQSIIRLCDRRFGIGSDGLILIQDSDEADFHMEFFNPDASKSFCGNGSRCTAALAYKLGIADKKMRFTAIDGMHNASLESPELVEVSMRDVDQIQFKNKDLILNTGSPHYVRFIDDLASEDIIKTGKEIRYSEAFKEVGINVNLVEMRDGQTLNCATYERGVENETLSCGTGVTAMAIAANAAKKASSPVSVNTKGGSLSVRFSEKNGKYTNVFLKGPANFVFKGEINL